MNKAKLERYEKLIQEIKLFKLEIENDDIGIELDARSKQINLEGANDVLNLLECIIDTAKGKF